MPEYIERKAAIEAAKRAWSKGLEPTQYIELIPAADVAPVVRCKDCKHCDFGEWPFAVCRKLSNYHNFTLIKEEFCNFGEEKKATWVPADYKPYLFVQCSRCAGRVPKRDKPPRCPHCNAKMDLEEKA